MTDWRNIDKTLDFTDQVVLVTGAGQGCGRAIAEAFAGRGARVMVNDVHADRASEVCELITASGGCAVPAVFDVTDYAAVSAAVADILRQQGRIDVLVNNAGNAGKDHSLTFGERFWETEPAEWQHWLQVNLDGVLHVCRAVIPDMIARRRGSLQLISSDAGRVGDANLPVYAAAKAGAAGLFRSLARALGRHNINANIIALGAMDTPASNDVLEDRQLREKLLRQYLIRRLGQVDEVAMLSLYLASAHAGWVTGQTWPLNGGFSLSL